METDCDSRLLREKLQGKRFVFLAVTHGRPVCPSEQVDAAWHLHLTYTRSYWEYLCRDVIRQPLHHGPTKGGSEEQTKFRDLYQQTLDSYERLLGQKPPNDIWSPASMEMLAGIYRLTETLGTRLPPAPSAVPLKQD